MVKTPEQEPARFPDNIPQRTDEVMRIEHEARAAQESIRLSVEAGQEHAVLKQQQHNLDSVPPALWKRLEQGLAA